MSVSSKEFAKLLKKAELEQYKMGLYNEWARNWKAKGHGPLEPMMPLGVMKKAADDYNRAKNALAMHALTHTIRKKGRGRKRKSRKRMRGGGGLGYFRTRVFRGVNPGDK